MYIEIKEAHIDGSICQGMYREADGIGEARKAAQEQLKEGCILREKEMCYTLSINAFWNREEEANGKAGLKREMYFLSS